MKKIKLFVISILSDTVFITITLVHMQAYASVLLLYLLKSVLNPQFNEIWRQII